jgi:MFS family permease
MHFRQKYQFVVGSGRGAMVVIAATAVMAAGFGGLGLITVFMGPIESDLGWSRSQTSLGYALATAGMAFGGVFWGRLSDRIDVRVPLAVAAAGMIGALFAMSGLRSLPAFYAANFIYGGLGFSAAYSALLSTSGEWFPERRGLVMGVVTGGGALGQGLLPFMANLLIGAFGWRWAFAGVAFTFLLVLGMALPVLRWPQGWRAPRHALVGGGSKMPRAEMTPIAVLGLAAFLCCMCMGIPVVHMGSFIAAVCGSPRAGVEAVVVAMTCGAVGRVLWGGLADGIGPLKAYFLASMTQTVCVLLFPAFADRVSLMAVAAMFGFGFAGDMTCFSLCVRRAVPAHRFGSAMGAVMMFAWAGMAAGGYLGGLLFEVSLSYTLPFLLSGLAGVLNLAVIVALATSARRAAAPGRAQCSTLLAESGA